MRIFGLTGSFGTGKTTTSKMFSRLGAEIIDADKIAHNLLIKDSGVYKRIISLFGEDILNRRSMQIDRKRLAKIVFNNQYLLKALCSIVHPSVILEIKRQIYRLKRKHSCRAVVIDAPLLVEAKLTSLVDKLIVVKAKREIQIKRMNKKMQLSKSEVLKVIKSQTPLKDKIKLADYVIDNNSSFNHTRKQVKDIWNNEIARNQGGWK